MIDPQLKEILGDALFQVRTFKVLTEEEEVAQAIYNTHWREGSPTWLNASEDVKNWVRAQAVSALAVIRKL